jgi:quercetin dioxygenase-like cupin family protein
VKITNFRNVKAEKVSEPGAKGVTIRWLISEKDGAPHFAMRLFEVEPNGYTPYHKHKWEHEVLILKGEGDLITENKTSPLKQGDAVFVPGEEDHQFKNTSGEMLVFVCMVPNQK